MTHVWALVFFTYGAWGSVGVSSVVPFPTEEACEEFRHLLISPIHPDGVDKYLECRDLIEKPVQLKVNK